MTSSLLRKKVIMGIVTGWILLLSSSIFAQEYYPAGFYVTGGGGYSFMNAQGFDLTPTSAGKVLRDDSLSKGGAGWTAGMGYKIHEGIPLRFDVVYIQHPNVRYNEDPIIPSETSLYTLKSEIQNGCAMADIYYDFYFKFMDIDYFKPYIGAGAGYSRNRIETKVTQQTSGAIQNVTNTINGLAWQVTIGARAKLTNNLVFDLGIRHADLGKLEWGPWTGTSNWKITSDSMTSDEAFLSAEIFFGDQTPQEVPSLINDNA